MSPVQRALFRVLVVVLVTVLALIVVAPLSERELDIDPTPVITTPSTTEPVIAHIKEP